MKPAFVLILNLALATLAHAQTQDLSNVVVGMWDECGYCSNHDIYYKSCTIARDGTVTIEQHLQTDPKDQINRRTLKIDTLTLSSIIAKTESARSAKMIGAVKTYSGDAPNFGVSAYPDTDREFDIGIVSTGAQVRDSSDARQLIHQVSSICGMRGETFLGRDAISELAP